VILAALVVAGGLALGYAGLGMGGDAAPPAKLAGFVDYGRSNPPADLGPGGLLPFRFAGARCEADGRSALLFENALGVKFYAVVGAIPPVDAPDRVVAIAPWTVAEYAKSSSSEHPVSCGPAVRPRAAGEYWLPMWEPRGPLCPASALTGATLRGSPDDPRISWVERIDGRKMDIGWPPGFRARFMPNLEVLDTEDHVAARAGAVPSGYCAGPDGSLLTDFLPADWYQRWYGQPTP
jgi:hypothetical protein